MAEEFELTTLSAAVDIEEEVHHVFENGDGDGDGDGDGKQRPSGIVQDDGSERWEEKDWSAKEGENGGQELGLWKVALSSMVAAGVQFGWALQLSMLTPYIQMLGIEHALSSFIWLCGPITGLVVQPCIGMWSDQCTSKWGRRRPFIFAGVILIMISVVIIGFAADIGSILGDSHEDCALYKGSRPRAIFVFVLGFWLLDLANNTIQGPARALLADLAGPDQRDAANAIFCLWMAFGNILGFSAGAYGDWYKLFPALTSKACCAPCGNLKAAFLLAILFLAICTVVTMIAAQETPLPVIVKEQQLVEPHRTEEFQDQKPHDDSPPLLQNQPLPNGDLHLLTLVSVDLDQPNGHAHAHGHDDHPQPHAHGDQPSDHPHPHTHDDQPLGTGLGSTMVNLLLGIRKLSPGMKSLLAVMALCWLSWFPFFLFDTDWMGREVFYGDPSGTDTQVTSYQRGVQSGAFGLLLNSVVLGISSFFIDYLCQKLGPKNLWAIGNFCVFISMLWTMLITATIDSAHGRRVAALVLFTVLGFPLAIASSVPYSLTAELTADSGGGQGLAMGILNLAVLIPQIIVALGAGPWDALFGGGNGPAFEFAAVSAFAAGVIAVWKLPSVSRNGYQRGTIVHGQH